MNKLKKEKRRRQTMANWVMLIVEKKNSDRGEREKREEGEENEDRICFKDAYLFRQK